MTKSNAQKIETPVVPTEEAKIAEPKVNPITPQMVQDLIEKHKNENGYNKSAVIRELLASGHTRSNIASALGIRYQFVNNVKNQEPKRATTK